MGRKRVLSVGVGLYLVAALGPVCVAGDDARNGDDASKSNKWRFGLYIETAFGNVAMDDLDASISTSSLTVSEGTFELEENLFGRAAVGWQLNPSKFGRFVFKFEQYKEDGDYQFSAQGLQSRAVGTDQLVAEPVVWWTVSANPNGFSSERTIPTWTLADDDNENGLPDADEVVPGPVDLRIQGTAPSNMANRVKTYDWFYERRFGGRRTRAEWSVGLRYFEYTGNISEAAWLNIDVAGVGYTDGGVLRLINFDQEASGFGPMFSIEIQRSFLRDRLVLYGNAHAAFVFAEITTDSGEFYTLVRDDNAGVFVTSPARLQRSTDKTTWQPGVELGLQVEVAEGLVLYAAYILNSYHDLLISPTAIVIPQNPLQAPFGVSGVYSTQDLIYDGAIFGLSFQF